MQPVRAAAHCCVRVRLCCSAHGLARFLGSAVRFEEATLILPESPKAEAPPPPLAIAAPAEPVPRRRASISKGAAPRPTLAPSLTGLATAAAAAIVNKPPEESRKRRQSLGFVVAERAPQEARTLIGMRDGQHVTVPVVFCDQGIAMSLMRWLFRSLTKSLASSVSDVTMDECKAVLEEAGTMRERGHTILHEGRELLKTVPPENTLVRCCFRGRTYFGSPCLPC